MEHPRTIMEDCPVALTQKLVQINSASPTLGSVGGPGETEIATYVASWLQSRDIEVHWIEPSKGRPSVVGVARGSGGGKSLMFNGHLDTVTLLGYEGDPLSGKIEDGKLYGRGAADMKCGLAAAMVALVNAKRLNPRGDVIFAGVADEEDTSIGTEDVLRAGWTADAALVNEPTSLEITNGHRGFVWFEVNIHGVAYHGSRPDMGVDAISKAGHFLAELDFYADRLSMRPKSGHVGSPSLHASTIKGGEEISSYPANCTITIERRTVPGETPASVEEELVEILERIAKSTSKFKYDIKATFDRSPFELSTDHEFSRLVEETLESTTGEKLPFKAAPYWTDCALLADAGIPALLWGPKGDGLHSKKEWVEVESINTVARGLTAIAAKFCK
ncbi:unnamed protein product [Fusarium equiseti]|uniref:Probable succinyl-diaminopimelate desuccinylase n=1 Tax=Fusarium equiseti TaxID=61235 RepID=A0A8J2ITN3_FUSEQ|nr:unnamed protein product [Fusarium equiseti]